MKSLASSERRSPYTPARIMLITAIGYWILTMGVWGLFAFDRGLNYETMFAVNCQSRGLYLCLIYLDNLRPYNSLFLGLSHLMGGDNGSYISYQLFYGFLWWSRGFLTFLIFRRIFPQYPAVGFLIGAIVVTHVTDSTVNWIGQIHQLGFMFCLVLAVYLLIESWYAAQKWRAALLLAASLIPLYISLWTYESQFFIIVLMPVVLFVLRPKITLPLILTSLIWWVFPAIYGYLQIQRYLLTKETTYQSSIMRPDLTVNALLQDLGVHLQQSLRFWKWVSGATPEYTIAHLNLPIGLLCAVAFLLTGYWVCRPQVLHQPLPSKRQLLVCLGVGVVILGLSFPIYLLIAGNTMFWRTQLLSSFGAAITLVAGILLLARSLSPKRYQGVICLCCCAFIVFSGVRVGVILQGFHEYRWRLQQNLMEQIAQLAPVVKDRSLILLTNLTKDYNVDPFGASMWFDAPVQLLYPGRNVVGHYFYADGSQPTDDAWEFTATGLRRVKGAEGMMKQFDQAPYDRLLVFNYGLEGKITLLETIPPKLLPPGVTASAYQPQQNIEPVLLPDRSIRMFAR
jgi:hypothetical protein